MEKLSKLLRYDFADTMLYNKLSTKLQNTNVLSPAQSGFLKDHRTSDHIFNLLSLTKKYVSKSRYLYACFADYWFKVRCGLKDKPVYYVTSSVLKRNIKKKIKTVTFVKQGGNIKDFKF